MFRRSGLSRWCHWHRPLLPSRGRLRLTSSLPLRLLRVNPLLLWFLRCVVSKPPNLRSPNLLPRCRRRAEWKIRRRPVLAGKHREFLSLRRVWRPLLRRSSRSGLARMTREGREGLRFR